LRLIETGLAWRQVAQMAIVPPEYCAIRGRFVPSRRPRPHHTKEPVGFVSEPWTRLRRIAWSH